MKHPLCSSLLICAALAASTSLCAAQPAPASEASASLRAGDRGPRVREVQDLLRRHGHELSADGDFGPRTEAAVRAFQRARGLSPDGVVGPRTRAALQSPARSSGPVGVAGRLRGEEGSASPSAPSATSNQPPSQIRRPSPSSVTPETRARALAWARAAEARGVRTLVIAFEGLWSFSEGYSDSLYEHQADLRAGRGGRAPRGASMSFVGKNLIAPTLAQTQASLEFIVLAETSENRTDSVGLQTALAFREVLGARLKLVLVGHSFGAYSALRLARKLEARGARVDHMLTIDARTMPGNYRHFTRPSNVGSLHNYFQKGLMPGYAIDGADLNQRLRGSSHGAIPGAAPVRARYLALLRAR